MKEYVIYFEIFGKKMKTTLVADSIEDAKLELFDKIIFHKVAPTYGKTETINPKGDLFNESNTLNQLKNIFGMK